MRSGVSNIPDLCQKVNINDEHLYWFGRWVSVGVNRAGGSIFAVPLLMAVLGWPFTQAATASLLAVAAAASIGTAMAWRHSYVRYVIGLSLGMCLLWSIADGRERTVWGCEFTKFSGSYGLGTALHIH